VSVYFHFKKSVAGDYLKSVNTEKKYQKKIKFDKVEIIITFDMIVPKATFSRHIIFSTIPSTNGYPLS
jgi:hypothetical protein